MLKNNKILFLFCNAKKIRENLRNLALNPRQKKINSVSKLFPTRYIFVATQRFFDADNADDADCRGFFRGIFFVDNFLRSKKKSA